MKKQYEVLQWASLFLEKHNCEPTIAEILLQHYLHVSRSKFYMMMQDPVPDEIIAQFTRDIKTHVQTGVPVQHLTGYEFFYGRKFAVTENTLIPRPETEELVQHIIKMELDKPTIIDIGTGSGVIAITLALEIPNATIYATDISEKALDIAKKNATELKADVTFVQGNFLKPIIEQNIQADIIVSNPPYIAKSDKGSMSRTVKDFDPELALFADENGLAAYQQILELSTKMAETPRIIAFEIGYQQGEAVCKLIKKNYPHSSVEIIQDINGKDRIVSAKLA